MGLTIKRSKLNLGSGIAKVMNDKSNKLSSQKLLDFRTSGINNYESNSNSKPFVKAWMRRILRKESSPSNPEERSGLFSIRRRRTKTRNNYSDETASPTTSRTVTDELSPQNCRSRSEESPRKMNIFEELSFRDTIQTDKSSHYPMDDMGLRKCGCEHSYNVCCDCISQDQKNKNVEENSHESSRFLSKKKSDYDGGEEKVDDDNVLKFSFQKSEIINKLFPMGYPTALATDNVSLENRETLDFEIKDQPDTRKDPDSCLEKLCIRTHESPFHRSEVINFLFPLGHPDDKEKVQPKCNSKFVETDSTSLHVAITKNLDRNSREVTSDAIDELESSIDHDCDKHIGLVISFDPTWDLLASIDIGHTTSMVKSRCKKFHEIENYTDSLLGNRNEEEASEESTDLLININSSFGTESSPISPEFISTEYTTKGKSSNCFDLGYHFDYTRFPPIDLSEVEICFYPDEASIGSIDDLIEKNNCNTSKEAGYLKFEEEFEFLDHSEELEDDVHDDMADSIGSVCGNISLDKSVGCVDFECNAHSPTRRVVVTTQLHSLSSMSSPPRLFTPHDIYLLTDLDTNEPTRYEKSSISLCLPQFGSSCSTTPILSYFTT